MQVQARVIIKTALLYAAAAFLVGGTLWINDGLKLGWETWPLLPVFYHLLMVGWTTQLIWGVAAWMFPPHSKELPRGNETLGWVAYGALNGGLLLRALCEPLQAWFGGAWGWGLAASALLQAAAIWIIVAQLWPRVKGRSTPAAKKPEARDANA